MGMVLRGRSGRSAYAHGATVHAKDARDPSTEVAARTQPSRDRARDRRWRRQSVGGGRAREAREHHVLGRRRSAERRGARRADVSAAGLERRTASRAESGDDSPRAATSGRDAAPASRGVRAVESECVRLHEVCRALQRVGRSTEGHDAPGPQGRREVLRRLLRRASRASSTRRPASASRSSSSSR